MVHLKPVRPLAIPAPEIYIIVILIKKPDINYVVGLYRLFMAPVVDQLGQANSCEYAWPHCLYKMFRKIFGDVYLLRSPTQTTVNNEIIRE
jgi:hypothetical protein